MSLVSDFSFSLHPVLFYGCRIFSDFSILIRNVLGFFSELTLSPLGSRFPVNFDLSLFLLQGFLVFSVPCFSFIVKHEATEESVSLGWVGLVSWPVLTPEDSKMTEQRHLLQCPSWLSWFSLDCSFNTMRKDLPPFFTGGLVCLRSVCLASRSAVCRGREGCSRVVYILYFNSLPIQCPLLHPYSPLSLWFYEPHSLVLWELMSFHLTCSSPSPFRLQPPLFHINKSQSSLPFQESIEMSVPMMMAPFPFSSMLRVHTFTINVQTLQSSLTECAKCCGLAIKTFYVGPFFSKYTSLQPCRLKIFLSGSSTTV